MPRISIAGLLALVIGCAIDLALLRQSLATDGPLVLAILGFLVMANVLAIGIRRLKAQGSGSGPFLKGFVACGLVSVVAHLACVWLFPATMTNHYDVVFDPLGKFYDKHVNPLVEASRHRQFLETTLALPIMFSISVIMALPQLLLALVVGWLSSRFKIVRRVPRSTIPPAR